MFQKIRRLLLLNNILIFTLVLAGFSAVVRLVFVNNLKQQVTNQLIAVGQGVVAEAELKEGRLIIDDQLLAQNIFNSRESFEWFDTKGKSVERMGRDFPTEPLDSEAVVEVFNRDSSFQSVTLPILDDDKGELIGYVRINILLDRFHKTVLLLDIGLGAGVVTAAILSGAGILWLNRQAMQPIEESFARLKQFTADASHELRSPLMAITSNAEVSLKYPEGMRDDDREALTAILNASDQMKNLTEDMLLLARTDRLSPIHLAPINLTELLKNLVQLYHSQAEDKNIKLTTDLESDLLIQGDPPCLTRAFTNLVQNAIRYTPLGGAIHIKARQSGAQVQVLVRDTGRGIAKDNLEKIFERFWRADEARKYNDGGSGLGLSITQAIVHSHSGSIDVISTLGSGSCFTINLPLASQP
ncbi:MAG: HAMP domain-containing sensor histidine kinase [Phormidesmis sp.]